MAGPYPCSALWAPWCSARPALTVDDVRPDVTIRTTTGDDGDRMAATVVAGYGPNPAAAIRDLTRCAQAAAAGLGDGGPFEVIGVRLVAGEVPDNDALRAEPTAREARRATRPGWCAYGTLTALALLAGRRAAG